MVVPPILLRDSRTTTMNNKQLSALKGDFSDGLRSSELMVSTISEWYDAKHRRPCADEVSFINSLAPKDCPYCGSGSLIKKGFQRKTGLRVWLCKGCGRRLSPLTGTIFDSRKIPFSEWIEYLIHLFEFHSTKTAAMDNRNSVSTGFYWLEKVFLVLKDYQNDIRLSGKAWIDEAYVPVWKSKREKRDGREYRGLSRNQCCICSGTDGEKCFLQACGKGKPGSGKALNVYGDHIEEFSAVIHDGELAHHELIEKKSLKSTVCKPSRYKKAKDKDNPMEPINKVHRALKRYLRSHGGYSRQELQNWLNLFVFIWNEGGKREKKAQTFIEMAVKKRVILRYRDWKNKKNSDKD